MGKGVTGYMTWYLWQKATTYSIDIWTIFMLQLIVVWGDYVSSCLPTTCHINLSHSLQPFLVLTLQYVLPRDTMVTRLDCYDTSEGSFWLCIYIWIHCNWNKWYL